MKLAAFIFSFFIANVLFAQEFVKVLGNNDLDSLVSKNMEENKIADGINGYRVQIFFGSDRKEATDVRTKFLQLFPEVEAYLVYQAPNFKVRIGDYRNKLEAQAIYREMLTKFDKVFIVPDKINYPKL